MRFYGDIAYEHPIRTVILLSLLMPWHANVHAAVAFYLYKMSVKEGKEWRSLWQRLAS